MFIFSYSRICCSGSGIYSAWRFADIVVFVTVSADRRACSVSIPKPFCLNVLRYRLSSHVSSVSDTRPCSHWVASYEYAPDTHQDQATGWLRIAEFTRPWLFRAPENLWYPVVSKSFGHVHHARPLTATWLWMNCIFHASPIQARNRGVSITTAPKHGAM